MAHLNVLYWRDIPSQIVVKQGRKNAKILLPERFQEAIDMAAMRDKSHDTDAYLQGWRKGAPSTVDGDLEAEAKICAAEIENIYDEEKLKGLIKSGGRE